MIAGSKLNVEQGSAAPRGSETMEQTTTEFDVDDPELPREVADRAFASGGYPYEERMRKSAYGDRLKELQRELVKLQKHLQESGERLVIVFEGRDAAGKGGTIKRYLEHLNPRRNRIVALPKPDEGERGQWYFQRYAAQLPPAGETALFDRSWYNRAGVEPVMGFSTPEETTQFLDAAPKFERMLVDDGIHLFKFWLAIGREMQMKRFHARRHNLLKAWKLSPVDLAALSHWDSYSRARDAMLAATSAPDAPWTVVLSNDKRRARVAVIQSVLSRLDYAGRDAEVIGAGDDRIVLDAATFLRKMQKEGTPEV